ncbi:MAG TPA: DUF99 family protein [Candidatus Nanoarchaeia archaeon]|nr:DUF99 family protein [Candidatus Nanoarchaeia archaeon]
MVKTEARILGIDDSPFNKFKDKRTLLIGTFFRGGSSLDGVLTTAVKVDGSDSTEKIISMVKKSKFRPQLQAIMLNGIAVGGFNVIDIRKLATKTKIPVIVVMRNYPEAGRMAAALAKLGMRQKAKLVEKAGRIHKAGRVYVQFSGCGLETVMELLRISCTRSHIPEPIRTAHLIAAGIKLGESKGKA